MVMNSTLIDLTALVRHLEIPRELESWLLAEYGWEPDDSMYEPSDLMDIIETHCRQFHEGRLDVSVPYEATLWCECAELARYMLKGVTLEKDACVDENIRLVRILEEHGIEY